MPENMLFNVRLGVLGRKPLGCLVETQPGLLKRTHPARGAPP